MIWTLIKINITALFAGLFRKGRSGKKRSRKTVVFICLLAFYLAFTFMMFMGVMFNSLVSPFFEVGIGWFYFSLVGLSIFSLCFFSIIFMVQPQLFAARDNELLLAMPIKPSTIVAGRLSALLIIEYIFAIIVLFPAFMVLHMRGFTLLMPPLGIAFFFLAAVLVPLLSLALGCFVGWLIALLSLRVTRGRTVIMLFLSVFFLSAYVLVFSGLNDHIAMLVDQGAEMADDMRRTLPPVYHLGIAVEEGNVFSFAVFALFVLTPFAAMCVLLSLSLFKLSASLRGRKTEYRDKPVLMLSARSTLLLKELRRYWSLPMYILNASLGVLATIGATAVLIFQPSLFLSPLEEILEIVPDVEIGMIGVIMLSAIAILNNVSAPSVSLEGKHLWIPKCMPVLPGDILLAKASMHIIVCGIPSLLAGIVCIFALPVRGFLPVILTIVLPFALTVMSALIGVAMNLRFPRFDWTNPIQPVKQGLSSILTLFGGIGVIVALIFIYALFFSFWISIDLFLVICLAASIIVSAAVHSYLKNAGSRKFEEL